jgi:hypothetical protein
MLFPFIASTIECEATALQHALLIAVSCGFERVKFESDCQMTVNAVNNGYIYLNELESLLSTCRSLISSNASYNLAFVRRQANGVAHSLARAFVFQSSSNIFYVLPSCIFAIIFDEMSFCCLQKPTQPYFLNIYTTHQKL